MVLAVQPLTAETEMDAKRLALIPERMQEFVDAGKTAGVVTLIQRHGEVAGFEAVGYQDLESRKPMRTGTIFQIMSMTKPVTGVGVMILMEEGRLSLMDPVEKHLPDFRGQRMTAGDKPTRPITVWDLMTHTSGMAGGLPPGMREFYRKFDKTLAEAVAIYSQQPLQSEPGAKWQYSNMGIATLGRIIEVIAGKPFEQFLAERMFEPLGMNDSFLFLPEDRRPRLASLYTYTDGKLVKSGADIFRTGARYPMPEGGMYSTAADLAAFYQMMLSGGSLNGSRILSTASVDLMTRNHTGNLKAGFAPGVGYGLTWAVVREPLGMFRLNSVGTYSHGGAFRTYGWVDPELDLVGVVLQQRTNVGGDLAEEISATIQIAGAAVTAR